jgi:hypothetical protein
MGLSANKSIIALRIEHNYMPASFDTQAKYHFVVKAKQG